LPLSDFIYTISSQLPFNTVSHYTCKMPQTIRKAVVTEFGDASKIQVLSSEISDPAPQQVQVRVLYSGFSGADINMRQGTYPLQKKSPLTPGYSLIGTVEQNGKGANKFQPGDLVACLSIYDAEAELANLPEKFLVPVPRDLDLQQATAMILDWNTAYGMVKHTAKVSRGQRVFIHGMSGAVGYAVVTLCLLEGADVYGTASARNHEALKELGTTPFVYTDKAWIDSMKSVGGADVVFDALGFESWDESYSILSSNGMLIGYGGNLGTLNGEKPRSVIGPTMKLYARRAIPFSGKTTRFYYITRDSKDFVPDLLSLFELLQQGKIRVPIKDVTDLEDIQQAHRNWGKAAGMGSMLVRVTQDVPS
jgi:NADPH:quinone reductase-like Zn-dependent oxidoreductase